jgi:hypothetical protein
LSPDDLLDRGVAKSADQLIFQVGGAHVEAKRLHIGAGHPEAEPGPLDSAPEAAFRTGVTQASYPDADPVRAQQIQEAARVGRTAHRHDGDAPAAGHLAARSASASSAALSLIPSTSTTPCAWVMLARSMFMILAIHGQQSRAPSRRYARLSTAPDLLSVACITGRSARCRTPAHPNGVRLESSVGLGRGPCPCGRRRRADAKVTAREAPAITADGEVR